MKTAEEEYVRDFKKAIKTINNLFPKAKRKNKNMIIWFTGQPGHGKTTLANALQLWISNSIIVDGDDLRAMSNNKDYTESGRRNNITLAQNIAKFLHLKQKDVIVALVSPFKDMREQFKKELNGEVFEIYVYCNTPRERDHFHVKDYESPTSECLELDTGKLSESECIKLILNYILP